MGSGLVAIGLTTLDIVARPIDALPESEGTTLIEGVRLAPAGTAGGAALVAARLGLKVKLVCAVGDDLNGRFVRLAYDEAGVDTALLDTLPGQPTSTTVLTIDSQGRRPNFHAPGAGMATRSSEGALAAVREARFVHYAGIGARALDGGEGAALLKAAKAAGATVACDLISPGRRARAELDLILPHVDWFMPSAAEARVLTGQDDLRAAGEAFLALGAGACIIKDGARGAWVFLHHAVQRIPAHNITPVDTTSCGDAFCAGFITGLDHGFEPLEAARFAAAVSAQVAQGLATLGALEGFDQALTTMRSTPLNEDAA